MNLSRGEAVALLNLLREARRLPHETVDPQEIFRKLRAEFELLVAGMHASP